MTNPFDRLNRHYILDENRQLVAVEMMVWARWYGDHENRVVEQTDTEFFHVSTVFLGLDHNFGKGPPLVFETMVFEKNREVIRLKFPDLEGAVESMDRLMSSLKEARDLDQTCWRWSSWDDAATNHAAIVRRLQKTENDARQQAAGIKKRGKGQSARPGSVGSIGGRRKGE